MIRLFALPICLLALASVCFAQQAAYHPDDIGPDGIDHKLGLRSCVRTGPAIIQLTFGSSFNPIPGNKPQSYRLLSETDPAYQTGQFARSVTIAAEEDVAIPRGWGGQKYPRYIATVVFPTPLNQGHQYFVQVLGADNVPVTGGRSAMWVSPQSPDAARVARENCLGIRTLEVITPTVLLVTTGDGLDLLQVDGKPGNFVLTCPEDQNFASGRSAVKIGRRSRGDVFQTEGWPYKFFSKHELFLVFDRPLQQGNTYQLNLNARSFVAVGQSRAVLEVSDQKNINPAIKVNQLGYLPAAPAKFAYAGAWMGSAGTLNLDDVATSFEVRDAATHAVVLTGTPSLRRRHEWSLSPDGRRQGPDKGSETVYGADLTYEDVWEMDLTPLSTPGRYYLTIPGMGRSFDFAVSPDIYQKAFQVGMIGLLHQRCGIAMQAPFSPFYRPACHRDMTELTTFTPTGPDNTIWGVIANHVIKGAPKQDIYGGHHDAGDYNPRSHLDVAEHLLLAYDMAPDNFTDGQTFIPESGNGVPDILDEARWQLDLWTRLQEPNGAVRGGIESDGDPNQITPSDLDYKRDFAFAPSPGMSIRVAGAWALASEFYRKLGKTSDADELLDRAKRAYSWGVRNAENTQKFRDDAALGAILLYRVTGERQCLAMFERASVFSTNERAELEEHGKHDQELASYYYASCPRPVNEKARDAMVSAFRRRADLWVRWAETTGYRYMRHPYAPNNWGTGSYPKWCLTPLRAYMLTGNRDYVKWVILTADFSLGCHPMNTVFIQRLGQRPISGTLHMNSRYAAGGPIPGIQSEGPSAQTGGAQAGRSMGTWTGAALFPHGPWPELHTYTDWVMVPGMNEGVVSDQAKNTAIYGVLINIPKPKLQAK